MSHHPFSGKVALVTGGSRGIGKGIVERLSRDGATVIFTHVHNEKAANELVDSLQTSNKTSKVVPIQCDVGRLDDIARLFSEIKEKYSASLDFLVCNAGVSEMQPLDNIDEESFDRMMQINVRGSLFVAQQALPLMNSGNGRIVYVSSSVTEFALPGASVYTASKLAQRGFVMVQAQELASKGITVNSVSPGPTIPGMFPEKFKEMAIQSSPFRRLGAPEDTAGVVAFLVGEDARWVTGQNILVNGGATI